MVPKSETEVGTERLNFSPIQLKTPKTLQRPRRMQTQLYGFALFLPIAISQLHIPTVNLKLSSQNYYHFIVTADITVIPQNIMKSKLRLESLDHDVDKIIDYIICDKIVIFQSTSWARLTIVTAIINNRNNSY